MIDGPPGYIMIPRRVFDAKRGDPLWRKPRAFSRWEAWIDLIQLAQWRDTELITREYGVVHLKRGEVVVSRRHLAKRWKWGEQSVRTFIAHLEKATRILTHRTTQAGTIYLIVNYDKYQDPATYETRELTHPSTHSQPTPNPRTRSSSSTTKRKSIAAAGASAGNLVAFPQADCDAAYDRWVLKIGAMDYGRFRKALLPVFVASPLLYSGEQLANAVDAFHEGMTGETTQWRGKWTVNRFAGELHEWVRLGAMELVDDFGMPTERGISARVFAA